MIAVVISVSVGFYAIYHQYASSGKETVTLSDDEFIDSTEKRQTLDQFRAFLRSLMMHAGIGTALGGVMTMVGEPQNLIIAKHAGWDFVNFFLRMAPVTIPVFVCGLLVCYPVERFKLFGYGAELPERVRAVLEDNAQNLQHAGQNRKNAADCSGPYRYLADYCAGSASRRSRTYRFISDYSRDGILRITEEHALGEAFEEALPFTALLTVFSPSLR